MSDVLLLAGWACLVAAATLVAIPLGLAVLGLGCLVLAYAVRGQPQGPPPLTRDET